MNMVCNKYICTLLLLTCGHLAIAQVNLSLEEKNNAAKAVYSVFENYYRNSGLSELGGKGYSAEKEQKLQAAFQRDAAIWDDLTPDGNPADLVDTKLMRPQGSKSFIKLINDYHTNFPAGVDIRIVNVAIDLSKVESKVATINVVRDVSGLLKGEYLMTNRASALQLVIRLSSDYKTAMIVEVKELNAGALECSSCKVKVKTKQSSEPDKESPKDGGATKGPGIGLDMGFRAGFHMNSASVSPFSAASYKFETPVTSNSDSTISVSPSIGFSSHIDIGLDVLFGKKRNVAVGVGFHYGYHEFSYDVDQLDLKYGVASPTPQLGEHFVRFYSAKGISEKIRTDSYGLSLALRYYAMGKSEKSGFYAEGGFNYMGANSRSSYSVANEGYGAVYQFRDGAYGFHDDGSVEPNDWNLTIETLQAGDSERDLTEFAPLNVFSKEGRSAETEKISFSQAMGFFIGAGGVFKLSQTLGLTVGIRFNYLSLQGNQYENALTEKTGNEKAFPSTLYVTDGIQISDFGLSIGMNIRLKK